MKTRRLAAISAALMLFTSAAARAQSAPPSTEPSATPTTSATTAASPAPGPTPTAAMTAQARGEFDAFRAGKVDRSHYNAELGAQINDTTVAGVSKELQGHGAVQRFTYEQTIRLRGHTMYVYRVGFARPPDFLEVIAWDANGKIEGLIFRESAS